MATLRISVMYGPRVSSADVYPVECALDRLLPPGVALGPLVLGPLRLPGLRLVPVLPELIGVLPEADREAGRVRRAECRRLCNDRAAHGDSQHVGLQLHAQ